MSAAAERALQLLGLSRGPLALASQSPRRRELLERIGVPLVVLPADIAEGDRAAHESPREYVMRLALAKAECMRSEARAAGAYVVLGADTVVDVEGVVLEKPMDEADAHRLLATIGGRWHRVWTGLALVRLETMRWVSGYEVSDVYFDRLTDHDRQVYIATGEPMDKAGAYGIQGIGGLFVPEIRGDYFNVMGMPLAELRRLAHFLETGGEGRRPREADSSPRPRGESR